MVGHPSREIADGVPVIQDRQVARQVVFAHHAVERPRDVSPSLGQAGRAVHQPVPANERLKRQIIGVEVVQGRVNPPLKVNPPPLGGVECGRCIDTAFCGHGHLDKALP